MRMAWRGCLALAGALLLASVALAGTIDRVKVGVTGRNATAGLSAALYLDVPVVADYRQSKFDGEQGDWQGPDYAATEKPGTGRTDLSFRSDFENNVGSLDGMARHALVHGTWTRAAKQSVRVPRLLGGRTVGAVGGELVLYQEPVETSARWESVLALPLCHGVFGAIDLYADAPAADTSGTAGQYEVGTTPAKQWNHDHALAAAQGVKLDGPLPGGHVAARAAGKTVTGVVADCGGGLQGVPLVLQRGGSSAGRGVSGNGGRFALPAHVPGTYRVVAALGPFRATSPIVTVR
jgi:hypothetical protein